MLAFLLGSLVRPASMFLLQLVLAFLLQLVLAFLLQPVLAFLLQPGPVLLLQPGPALLLQPGRPTWPAQLPVAVHRRPVARPLQARPVRARL